MARILIVDDEASIRTVLDHALKSAGYEVSLAENGREASKQQRATPADLAIVDLFMPDEDGLETIMEFHREFPNVRLIAISGNDLSGAILAMAKEFGADRILEKPFDNGTMLKLVAELLKRPS